MYQNGAWVHTMDFGAYITIANTANALYLGAEHTPGEYLIGSHGLWKIWNICHTPLKVARVFEAEKRYFGVN